MKGIIRKIIILLIIIISFILIFFSLKEAGVEKDIPNSNYSKCLGSMTISGTYSDSSFYVEFKPEIKEEEIINLINEYKLTTDSLSIHGDIYIIRTLQSALQSDRLIFLLELLPKVSSVKGQTGGWVIAEFYKNVTQNESRRIIDEIIEAGNITIIDDKYSPGIQFLERRSVAYLEISNETEFTVIELICKFRENEIVKSAGLISTMVSVNV